MLIVQPGSGPRLGDLLKKLLADTRWQHLFAAVAFVKRSGVQHIAEELRAFAAHGSVKMLVGVDLGGTSREGLAELLACVGERGEIWVCHNESASTFHPKVYVFRNEAQAIMVMGSGNLTEGGLFTNYEASMARMLDLSQSKDRMCLKELDAAFDGWLTPSSGTSQRLTPAFLEKLCQQGYVDEERRTRGDGRAPQEGVQAGATKPSGLFAKGKISRPPSVPKPAVHAKTPSVAHPRPAATPARPAGRTTFVMTLQRTDCGVGQVTAGTSRRSPEIFIPLVARDRNPAFWGWPDEFEEDPRRKGKFDRRNVAMTLANKVIRVNMMTWPAKHDFRLRAEDLRSAGSIGDILKVEQTDNARCPYAVEVVARSSPDYAALLRLCAHSTPNSKKRWGYV